jgi:hypothetical protein
LLTVYSIEARGSATPLNWLLGSTSNIRHVHPVIPFPIRKPSFGGHLLLKNPHTQIFSILQMFAGEIPLFLLVKQLL